MREALEVLDGVMLKFNEEGTLVLYITLAFVMFGVALGLKMDNFKQVILKPKSAIVGIFSQFILLPALTFLLIKIIDPSPSVALGMILVAACPGGNISNFITTLAKGNAELSVSLTGIADLSAIIMTPFNFAFWAKLYNVTSGSVIPITIEPVNMLLIMLVLLGIPTIVGMLFAAKLPKLTAKIITPIKIISILIFLGYIVGALSINFELFYSYVHLIFIIVLIHNTLALLTGFSMAKLFGLAKRDTRTITIETGIQNSGLGLVLIFKYFDGLGGMAFIAAWWGIWHIISGLIIGSIWGRKAPKELATRKQIAS